jgi:hypothetical protein
MRKIAMLLGALVLGGCNINPYNVRPVAQSAPAQRHVVEKNYELGQEHSAFVGQPLVRVKDYYVETRTAPAFSSPAPMSASWWGSQDLHYPEGFELRAAAQMDLEGVTYYIAQPSPPLHQGVGMLVAPDGRFRGGLITRNGIVFTACAVGAVCVSPAQIDFRSTSGETILKGSGFVNFELIYSGATKDALNLLYREYTPDDMARPAFTQNLTYDRDSSAIRFREMQIRVLEASNESLRYVVEADGLKEG